MSMIPSIQELFDLSQTEHAELFDEVQFPWEVLTRIAEYLEYALEHATIDTDISHAAYIGKNISIGKNTIIEPGVTIHGPAIIGKNCTLRTGSYIRGNVIVGDDCIIGNSTELKNCVLFNTVTVPHFNYVGDSVLGSGVHLGAGVVLSNFKHGGAEITVTTLRKTYKTGLNKFGAIIGDGVEIGSNSVLNPGCIIGKNAVLYPLTSFRGILPPNSIVKLRQQQEIVVRNLDPQDI